MQAARAMVAARTRSPVVLPLLALGAALAVVLQGLAFVLGPGGRDAQPRGAFTAARGSAVVRGARGGADDEDDYEFVGAQASFATLKPGMEFEGVVIKVLDFGVFVDIGAEKEGLVPRGKMSDKFVEKCSDICKVGDGVTVWVSEVDRTKNSLTLSMSKKKIANTRSQGARADLSLFEGIDSSEWLTGTVANIQPFGAFVALAPPSGEGTAQGLVHITQIKDDFVEDVEKEVQIGQEVKVRVLGISNGKMSLTMKSVDAGGGGKGGKGGADLKGFEGVADTEWLPGIVKSLVNFGAFVEVTPPNGPPAQGLLHISQIKEGFLEDPGEELEVDQKVKVRVTEVDMSNGKLSLSMKEKAPM